MQYPQDLYSSSFPNGVQFTILAKKQTAEANQASGMGGGSEALSAAERESLGNQNRANSENYEQIAIPSEVIGELDQWITEEDICKVLLWDEKPISIVAPNFVDLVVAQTDPGVKGDTATGGSKPAILSTGATVKVPLFVSEGETITVDTRNGEYQGRK